MTLPFVSCLCPTFGRAPAYLHLLSEAVEGFLRQDYPADRRELVILNDTPGQVLTCSAPGVKVVNLSERISSLGKKRDALCREAKGDIFVVWDDDDISLPHRVSQAVGKLSRQAKSGHAIYTRLHFNPRRTWWLDHDRLSSSHNHGCCHNASAFTRAAWEKCGGYPDVSVTEDQGMDGRLCALDGNAAPLTDDVSEWSYVYRWGVSDNHISGGGSPERDWQNRGRQSFPSGTWEIISSYAKETKAMLAEIGRRAMRWGYGITTVPSRRETTFLPALKSLAAAGFDQPVIFVDGSRNGLEYRGVGPGGIDLEMCLHSSPLQPNRHTPNGVRNGCYGNWLLALMELWIRFPQAHRYALFQDDILASKNLRAYLEHCDLTQKGYWNLYTFPENEPLSNGKPGWHESNQWGRSATGLVFHADVVRHLLTQPIIIHKPHDPQIGHRRIDGAVVEALSDKHSGPAGWREYVHNPSLLQHVGNPSSIGNEPLPQAMTWKGEDFDCLSLLSPQPGKQGVA